jgi:hypothetical protein
MSAKTDNARAMALADEALDDQRVDVEVLLSALNASQLLEAALAHVESDSIRAWAMRQRGPWLRIAKLTLDKKNGDVDPVEFASYIMICAMGM